MSLPRLYHLLYEHYGPQQWWPADTPFEVVVGAILTQNTNWLNVEKAIVNLRQARSIHKKLEMMDWEMRRQGSPGEMITEIPADVVETLARVEHEQWTQERRSSGWVFGETKDLTKKISPYLVPYHQLPEETKELDRDTIRNIPDLLAMIGMRIYKR